MCLAETKTHVSPGVSEYAVELRRHFEVLSMRMDMASQKGEKLPSAQLIDCVGPTLPLLVNLSQTDFTTVTEASSLTSICLPLLSRVHGQNSERFRSLLLQSITSIIASFRERELPLNREVVRNHLTALNQLPGSPFSGAVDGVIEQLNAEYHRKAAAIIAAEKLITLAQARGNLKGWKERLTKALLNIGKSNCPALSRCISGKLVGAPPELMGLPTQPDHPDYVCFKDNRRVQLFIDQMFCEMERGFSATTRADHEMIRNILAHCQDDMSILNRQLSDANFSKSLSRGVLCGLEILIARAAQKADNPDVLLEIIAKLHKAINPN